MSEIWKEIKDVAENSDGCFTTKQIEDAGINRIHLQTFVKDASLIRIRRGLYMLNSAVKDDYAALQNRRNNLLFSHETALYFWGMSERIPHMIDVTIPSGTNVSRIKKDSPDVRFHYIKPELFEIGQTEAKTPIGSNIRLYDKERCICDIIRNRKNSDMQIYSQAIKDYFHNQPDLLKLMAYGRLFGIEDKIRIYTEILL